MLSNDLDSLFKKLLAEHSGTVLKVARAYTLTNEECQDLAQEILLQAWRSLPQYQGRARVSTWFYRVALNTALGWQRKERHRRQRHQPLFALEELPVAGTDAAQQVNDREMVQQLYAAIQRLTKADAALILLYLDDLSYREIAEVLGISENNVGVKLNRAKCALSELLNEVKHER